MTIVGGGTTCIDYQIVCLWFLNLPHLLKMVKIYNCQMIDTKFLRLFPPKFVWVKNHNPKEFACHHFQIFQISGFDSFTKTFLIPK